MESTFVIKVDIKEAIKDYQYSGYHEGLAWYLSTMRGVPWAAAAQIERDYMDGRYAKRSTR